VVLSTANFNDSVEAQAVLEGLMVEPPPAEALVVSGDTHPDHVRGHESLPGFAGAPPTHAFAANARSPALRKGLSAYR
jgi:hypothetical protein